MKVHQTIHVRPQGVPSMFGHTSRVRDRQKALERRKNRGTHSERASTRRSRRAQIFEEM